MIPVPDPMLLKKWLSRMLNNPILQNMANIAKHKFRVCSNFLADSEPFDFDANSYDD
jgi:hypothetical protein